MSFEEATALERTGEVSFRGLVPDRWQQGKGAFGGVMVGMMARAMIACEGERRLRSLSADLCAPALCGPVDVEIEVLRRGASATFLGARLRQSAGLLARASASFAAAREIAPPGIEVRSPPVLPWRAVDVVPVEPPLAPVFTQHYEYRPTGPVPFTGGTEALASGYLRPKVRPEVYDVPAVCALLDAWWPTVFPLAHGPRGVATVGYTMQLLVDPKVIPVDVPLRYSATGVDQDDNFFVEMRELWSGDRRVAMNQQTFALLT